MTSSDNSVRAVVVRGVDVPMAMPLHTSTGALTSAPLVLIDVETSAGIVGRAYLFAFTRANIKPIAALVEAMGSLIVGQSIAPFDVERNLRQKYTLLGVHNVVLIAMSGIDVALWDAHAQHLGLGRPNAADDVAAVRAVKQAVGSDVTLMCDFNQALSVNEAIVRGRLLDDEGGLLWIEEPTRADDFAGNARIADALDTPVQIGENFMGPEQMAQALSARASDFVMPDLQRIGGVTGWMRAAALAQAAGCEMSSHLFPEVSSHLLAVTPTCQWLEYVDWAAPILAEPAVIEHSHVVTPAVPGNGMRWDERAVEKYRV